MLERAEKLSVDEVKTYDLGLVENFPHKYIVEIVDPCDSYVKMMKELFNFD